MSLGDLAHIYGVTRQAMWDLNAKTYNNEDSNLTIWKRQSFYRGGARADERASDILENARRIWKIA